MFTHSLRCEIEPGTAFIYSELELIQVDHGTPARLSHTGTNAGARRLLAKAEACVSAIGIPIQESERRIGLPVSNSVMRQYVFQADCARMHISRWDLC